MTELKTNKDILEELNSLNKTVNVSNEEEQTTEYKKGWEVGFSAAKHMFYQKSRQSAIEWIKEITMDIHYCLAWSQVYRDTVLLDNGKAKCVLIDWITHQYNITEEDLKEGERKP